MIHFARFIVGLVIINLVLIVMTVALRDQFGVLHMLGCIWLLLSYWVGWASINGIMWLGIQIVQIVFNHNVQSTDGLQLPKSKIKSPP
jgi:hypothetical protein